jgi:hypothetical protein
VNKNGDALAAYEFHNSWGGAALIWDYFTEKYFPLKPGQKRWETGIGMGADLKPVWDLWKRKDLSEAERVVMMSTFDNVMVRKEDLNRLADAFEAVLVDMQRQIPELDKRANHMHAQAEVFRKITKEQPDVQAICWQQTTCGDDPWYINPVIPENYDELTEQEQIEFNDQEGNPYNINTGTKHWFLYEELKAQDGETN